MDKGIVDKVKNIVGYIWAHQSYGNLSYLLIQFGIDDTRVYDIFCINFLMIDWLIKVKRAMRQAIIHLDWTAYVNRLIWEIGDRMRSAIKACQIKAYMNIDKIWVSCNIYWDMFDEVMKIVRVFDGMELVMGKA